MSESTSESKAKSGKSLSPANMMIHFIGRDEEHRRWIPQKMTLRDALSALWSVKISEEAEDPLTPEVSATRVLLNLHNRGHEAAMSEIAQKRGDLSERELEIRDARLEMEKAAAAYDKENPFNTTTKNWSSAVTSAHRAILKPKLKTSRADIDDVIIALDILTAKGADELSAANKKALAAIPDIFEEIKQFAKDALNEYHYRGDKTKRTPVEPLPKGWEMGSTYATKEGEVAKEEMKENRGVLVKLECELDKVKSVIARKLGKDSGLVSNYPASSLN